MRKLFIIPALLVIFGLSILLPQSVSATSAQAYQDYLYQNDLYRQSYTNFQVAKNEYEKFKSLSAQTDAIDKTKSMLTARNSLLRSYLMLLQEKLAEDQGLPAATKQLYQTLIQNEIIFLDKHSLRLPAAASLRDLADVSEELESHYVTLQISIRQMLTGLSLGQLSILKNQYDKALSEVQTIVNTFGNTLPPAKQETINRWILQIKNKRSFFQQKYDSVSYANTQLTAMTLDDLDRKYSDLTKSILEARQYLSEGSSFFIELADALKYSN